MYIPKLFTTVTPLSITLAIFLIVLLPLLGVYIGYKYGLNTVTSKRDDQETVLQNSSLIHEIKINVSNSQIEGWKIYRNEIIGLQFEYPKTWILTENGNSISLTSPETQEEIDHWQNNPTPTNWPPSTFIGSRDLYIKFYPDVNLFLKEDMYQGAKSIEDIYIENENGSNMAEVYNIEQLQIGDITAKEFSFGGHYSTYGIHAIKGIRFYSFEFANTMSKDELGTTEKQIISTIRIF